MPFLVQKEIMDAIIGSIALFASLGCIGLWQMNKGANEKIKALQFGVIEILMSDKRRDEHRLLLTSAPFVSFHGMTPNDTTEEDELEFFTRQARFAVNSIYFTGPTSFSESSTAYALKRQFGKRRPEVA